MVDQRVVIVLCFLFPLFHFTLQQTQPLSSFFERRALLELRSSLGLRSREWPKKADPCLVWKGIQCRNGSVVGINVSGFRRTRIGRQNPQFAVDSLENLTMLESFNASRLNLPGPIPEWLGRKMVALQLIDLRSCHILGSIPFTLGNLTSLVSLYLSDNSLTGFIPSTLGQLSRLSVLDLSQNSLTGSIPTAFGSLKNLSFLNISSNFLAESIPLEIGTLPNLLLLNFSNNSLSSSIPAELGGLSGLVELDLSFNSLSGSLPVDLRGMRNLQTMAIGNNFLTGSLPDDMFPSPSKLELIVLSRNGFTGPLPNALWSMPRLRVLDVSSNNFSGALPNFSLDANITAEMINISHNMFFGSFTSVLERFNSIILSGNYFEGRVPGYAQGNVSLDRNCLQNVTNQRTLTECTSFYAERGLIFDQFGFPNVSQHPATENLRNSNRKWIILGGVLGGVIVLSLLTLVLLLVILCARKRSRANQTSNGIGPITSGASPPPSGPSINFSSLWEAFTYQQLLQATGDFGDTNLIKHGHSGDLFCGVLEGGIPVVVKRVNLQSVKREGYLVELDIFSKLSHTRLVPFIGHCLGDGNEKFMVYKNMPNGDLSSALYRKTESEDGSLQSLDWITRLKIALGAAEGLSYLHHECFPPLVHRDVQASSILLDDKFEVRLGSLSMVCAQEEDAHQSRITRLLRLPQTSEQSSSGLPTATCAYDVYCFGKVLLELVTGKLGISASNNTTVKEWLEQTLPYINIYDKELVTKIVDSLLIVDEDLLEEIWAMAIVAKSCLNPKPSRRPLMRYILKALENPLKVVREESNGSGRLRATSSRGSWNVALFGSWRHSSSDAAPVPVAARLERGSSFKQSGTSGSQGSGGQNGGGDHSSSRRRHSNEICPEPSDG